MRALGLAVLALLLAGPAWAQRPPAGGLANPQALPAGGLANPQALPAALSSSPARSEAGAPHSSSPARSAPDTPLPLERVLPMALAEEAAAAAVAACAREGYRVSAAVADRAGQVRVLLRGDGAGPHTLDSSARKAYTAVSLGGPTSRYADIAAGSPAAAGLRDIDRLLLLAGGLPIEAGGEIVGAIGVGGAPSGDKDDACARAGIDRIRDRLK